VLVAVILLIMNTLILLGFFISLGFALWLSIKTADYHYKTYTGDQPLYILYAILYVVVYVVIISAVAEFFL
jgi:hypothetical protein